jgi:hypothetical protein
LKIRTKSARRGIVAAAISCALCAALAGSATAASASTITFTEPEKGASFRFIDNAPTAKLKHGFPTKISPGDELAIWNPLVSGGQRIGHLQAFCVATKTARNFVTAAFECPGTFVFSNGTLTALAVLTKSGAEGAITGGTGIYANASGTFASKESKGVTTTTVTLVP